MSHSSHPHITRLVVKNYRSLADVELTFSPLTVLVGPNNVGKSNLIDALHFVRDAININVDFAVTTRDGIGAIRHWTADGTARDISFHVYLQDERWAGEYGFRLTPDGATYRVT